MARSSHESEPITTDDLIPILVYVVIQSQFQYFESALLYAENFLFADLSNTKYGYDFHFLPHCPFLSPICSRTLPPSPATFPSLPISFYPFSFPFSLLVVHDQALWHYFSLASSRFNLINFKAAISYIKSDANSLLKEEPLDTAAISASPVVKKFSSGEYSVPSLPPLALLVFLWLYYHTLF